MTTRCAGTFIGVFLIAALACRDASRPAAPALTAALTGPPTIQHSVSNGPTANVQWYNSDASGVVTWGDLDIHRDDAVNNPQTILFYQTFQCTPNYDCTEIAAGYGTIPNGDFTSSEKRMHLNTSTANANFEWHVGEVGDITVDWQVNGIYSYEQKGVTSMTTPGDTLVPGATRTTYRLQGSWSSWSANAQGSVLGREFANTNAGMGTAHNVLIEISR
jgi:hypothetical protein